MVDDWLSLFMGDDVDSCIGRDANNGMLLLQRISISLLQSGESRYHILLQDYGESIDPFVDSCILRQRRLTRGYAEMFDAYKILSLSIEDCYSILFDLILPYTNIFCKRLMAYY